MTKEELKEMIKSSIMNEMHCANEVREQEEEIETEETEEVEIDTGIQLSPEEQEVQSALEKALDAAKKLGNPKLVTQIGNTITFFTRSEIIKEEKTEEDIRAKFLRTLRMPNNAL
jgi:hypothetical protein|tara:strand:+ start:451 stop:795 length:345 start_codon:yes stop_codon:yes gene_type:complete